MTDRRLTTRAAFLLLAVTMFSGGAHQRHRYAEAPESVEPLRFGQSIALSDFDADGLVDEARLEGSSLGKSVGVLLSGTGKRSFLHFNSNRIVHGSLLAQDIDNDGATDLIWTDLFRSNDVVVWLGDGSGGFEQVDSSECGRSFAPGNTDVAEPDGSYQETAINFETNRPSEQPLNQKSLDRSASELPNYYPDRLATSSPALGQPTGRDPPFFLS